MEDFKHLQISREQLQNPKRSSSPPYAKGRMDRVAHGQSLIHQLPAVVENQQNRSKAIPNSVVLRLPFKDYLDFEKLEKHGVSFVTMEGEDVCIAFADERGLAIFAERLQMLVDEDDSLTYAQLFEAIDKIGNWEKADRISWALKTKGFPTSELFMLDVELWPLGEGRDTPLRRKLRQGFEVWLQEKNIAVIDRPVNHDDLLMYRVQVNHSQAEQLLEHNDVRYVDLLPSTGISHQQLNLDINEIPKNIPSPLQNAAKVCILDSGINSNHLLLKSAIADGQSYIPNKDAADESGHGTHVAGIALYGDVHANANANYWQPQLWLLNGRILNERNEFDVETIENTLDKAVRYFVDEYQCKIFNLSIGNVNAPYSGAHVKGIAYVLDMLARELDVLFIISTGNFTGNDELEIPDKSWRTEYPSYLLDDVSVIIDPAPALNGLTVGSHALHELSGSAQRYPHDLQDLPVASAEQPSPFTRHGPSVKKALKPELIAHGGNYTVNVRNGKQHVANSRGLGVVSLNHQPIGATLLSESSGTSFAAPYISHLAGRLLNEYPDASANLLRALLVNQSVMPDSVEEAFPDDLVQSNKDAKRLSPHREVSGYGKVDEDILYRSTEQAVALYVDEKIEDNTYHFYELPLPDEYFQGSQRTREIRVTLSYMPPVKRTRIEYRGSRMWFRLVKGESLEQVQKHFNKADEKGVRSMGDYSNNREVGSETRDRGTVQSDVWRLKRPNKGEKWFVVVLRNDYAWAENMCDFEEPYALVVSVADRENEQAQLYTRIRQQLQQKVQARQRV